MSSQQPTEVSLLSSFLLPPTPLSLSVSLQDFRSLFPRQHQSDPIVPLLYRELQHQVALGADEVRRNVAVEAEQGRKLANAVRKTRIRREAQIAMEGNDDLLGVEDDGAWMEVCMENELKTQTLPNYSAPVPTAPHTPSTLISTMKSAIADLQTEVVTLESQNASLLREMQTSIGDLSDLRYGKFPVSHGGDDDLAAEVIEGIKRVGVVCLTTEDLNVNRARD